LECGSGNCASSICRPLGGGFPAGGFCTCNDVCLSNHCNMGTMTCGS
jgi:hypothetical protein